MKSKSVFGTQDQQDAAWAKAWKQIYKSTPPSSAARNNKAQDKQDVEWARKYQAMTYAAQYGK